MFKKASHNRLFQDVVGQVQSAILDGRFHVGDILPPERKLLELFGISRGTLREAMRVLEQKGLIEIRPGGGGGAVVRGATTDHVSESLALLIRHRKVSLDDLAEFREGIEGIVTGNAARRATEPDVEELENLLSDARRYCAQGTAAWDRFIRVDERMHMTLARISRNPVYGLILRTVHDNIHEYYDRFLAGEKAEMAENMEDLEKIVDAVARRDAEGARILAQDHVHRFNRHMQKRRHTE
jgi:GntR family transcriptional regulator, transcriptional repressor for pyruvate dehydrogenase complex